MASGQCVVEILSVIQPAASYATPNIRAGGSTPAEAMPVYEFDDTTKEYLDFICRLSDDYDGGGLTFTLPWMAATATSGKALWGIAIRAFPDDAEDQDAEHTYVFNEAADTAASAAGELSYPTIAFTNGADMDSWAAGQIGIVRVYRHADDDADTMTGDAQLLVAGLVGKET